MQSTIKKYVKIRKLILHQVFIERSYWGHAHYQRRMKLPGTCSISKESHKKKKKKMGLLFWGSGTPTFWLGLLLFIKRESWTPTFKILVRTLLFQIKYMVSNGNGRLCTEKVYLVQCTIQRCTQQQEHSQAKQVEMYMYCNGFQYGGISEWLVTGCSYFPLK